MPPHSVKEAVIEIFDQYKKYFQRTYSLCLLLSVFVFVVVAVLFKFSKYDSTSRTTTDSLLRCIYWHYSSGRVYSIVDWSKPVYLSFIAFFALSFYRAKKDGAELLQGFFLKNISPGDAAVLLITLAVACAADAALYCLDLFLREALKENSMATWIYYVSFQLRIYVPIVAFAVAVTMRIDHDRNKFSMRSILVLLATAWLFNEFSYETVNLIRLIGIHFITMMMESEQNKFVTESVLGIPLLACYFIGFAVVMLVPASKEFSVAQQGLLV